MSFLPPFLKSHRDKQNFNKYLFPKYSKILKTNSLKIPAAKELKSFWVSE